MCCRDGSLLLFDVGANRVGLNLFGASSGPFWLVRDYSGQAACQDRFAMGRAGQIPSGRFGAGKFGLPVSPDAPKKTRNLAVAQQNKVFSKKDFRFNKNSVCVETCYISVLLKWFMRFIKTFYFFRKLFRCSGIRHRRGANLRRVCRTVERQISR